MDTGTMSMSTLSNDALAMFTHSNDAMSTFTPKGAMAMFTHSNSTNAAIDRSAEDSNEALSLSFRSIAVVLLQMVIMFFIVSGNTMVIMAVWRFPNLQTTTNQFVVSLAVTDLLVGLVLPFHATIFMLPSLAEKKYLCLARFASLLQPCCASVANLLLVSIDRYIAILYPLRYPSVMTKHLARLLIAGNWIQSSVQGSVPFFYNKWHDGIDCAIGTVLIQSYILISSVINVFFIGMAMITLYGKIFQVAMKQRRAIRQLAAIERVNQGNAQASTKEVNTTKTLAIVVGTFLCCWVPFVAVIIARSSGTVPWQYESIYSLSILTGLVNSMVNPIIYAWKNKPFRIAFNRLLKREGNQVTPLETTFTQGVE